MRARFRGGFLLLCAFCAIAPPVHATTLTVTNLDDSGPGSLRDTIAAADSGDTIVFAVTGTITLTSGTISIVDKSLTIEGPGAPGLITITRASGSPAFQLFYIIDGTAWMSGLTFTNGSGPYSGGAIANNGGTLIVTNCVFANNRSLDTQGASGGGAISSWSNHGLNSDDNATLEVYSCNFINNSAVSSPGGAIGNYAELFALGDGEGIASAIVENCTFSQNSAEQGGAVFTRIYSRLTIRNSTFTQNTSEFHGGAISAFGNIPGNFHVENCTFDRNESTEGSGGAVRVNGYLSGSECTVTGSCFFNNEAGLGGAILCEGPLALANTTFDANRARASLGGVIFVNSSYGEMSVNGCTLRGLQGSLIHQQSPTENAVTTLGNTILSGPAATLVKTSGTIISNGYNLCADNGGGFLTGPGDQTNTDPQLDGLGVQNNGGPTPTIALTSSSPALDQGSSFGLPTDQRGLSRPFDIPSIPNAAGGDGADIGAYEARADPVQNGYPSLVVTTADDHNDNVCGGVDCTLREAIARSNALLGPNAISFTPGLTGTITLQPAAGGQLTISDSVTIIGNGARVLKVSANTQDRVFFVTGNGNSSVISGLTIADGRVDNSNAGDSEGGGIYNQVTLSLVDCTLDFNRAIAGSGFMTGQNGGSARGGGVFNAGALTLNRCTFNWNGAGGGSGAAHPPPPITVGGSGGDGRGGAVYNATGASLSIVNCTFSSNFVYGGNGGSGTFGGNGGNALGSAIFNLGTLNADVSTFSLNNGDPGLGGLGSNPGNNGAPGGGVGALSHGSGASTLRACIIAGNTANAVVRDAYGDFISGGFNLIGRIDGSTGFNAATDQSGTNAAPLSPQLGALANNGGQTDTMSPLPGSPVVDKGNGFGLTTDQRGMLRPVDIPGISNANGGDGSDIGAVELTPIFVTMVDDHDDGTCTVGDCTLREAINTANLLSGDDTIAFAAGATGTVQLIGALPQISTSMVIAGPGANVVTVRRNTAPAYRIFVIANPPQNDPVVTLSGLTIANGLAPNGGTPIDSGGGIINDRSTLTVRDCVLTGNSSSAASFSYGGAIMNSEGHLTVDRCTFSGNNGYYGGGIANRRNSAAGISNVTITNSAFVANTAAYGNGLNSEVQNSGRVANVSVTHCTFSSNTGSGNLGAGIYNSGAISGTANLTVSHCTFAENAANQGSSVYNFAFNGTATATLRDSIFATDSGSNLVNSGASMSSLGYNLSNDGGAGILNNATDITNTAPLLAALASNGGPTQTHALLSLSPALDKGRSFFLPLDQRGLPRVADSNVFPNVAGGDGADIGAFEVNPFSGIIDSDGDGMPDEFEVFFDVDDPNGDPDGDGDNNLTEYRNRTNPRDSSSYLLRIISIVRSGNDIVITFNAVAGKTFRLERKDTLTDLDWLSIPGTPDLTPMTTGNAQLTHVGGISLPRSFYRVRLLP